MKAFPYDAEDPLGGDHEFYAPGDEIDYNDGDTFEQLVERKNSIRFEEYINDLKSGNIDQDTYDSETSEYVKIVGFWLVSEEDLAEANKLFWSDESDSDSSTYSSNHKAKVFLDSRSRGIITADGCNWYK